VSRVAGGSTPTGVVSGIECFGIFSLQMQAFHAFLLQKSITVARNRDQGAENVKRKGLKI